MKHSYFVAIIIALVLLSFVVLYAKLNFSNNKVMYNEEVKRNVDIPQSSDSFVKDEMEFSMPDDVPAVDQDIVVTLQTNMGDIRLGFFSDEAPIAVENFLKLARSGFYSGVKFHRVIKDFMIQTGDPNSKDDDWSNDGQGGPGYTIKDEFNMIPFYRGILGMAKTAVPDSGGSQFFIVTNRHAQWLNGQYTVFGRVLTGMDVVDAIENIETTTQRGGFPPDHPITDVIITRVVIEE